MRIVFFLLICISTLGMGQDQISVKRVSGLQTPLAAPSKQEISEDKVKKVKIIHADKIKKDPKKYNGNQYFTGNVQIEHQGSVLTADEIVLYNEENFVKAIGNTKLQNTDGSVIIAREMEYDANTQKGVAKKNVLFTDSHKTMKTDILYYDRLSNQVYFNTGGTITDDQNTTYAKIGTYFLNTKVVDLIGNVKIEAPEYTMEGFNIKQNQNTQIANINGPTTITSKTNPKNRLYTEKGTYKMDTKEAYLTKNSRIFYNEKILTGDDIYYNQILGFGKATGNVTLDDPNKKRYIKGGYGEVFEKKDSAVMTKSPYAVKVMEKDSIYFSAEKIISYQKLDSLGIKVKQNYMRAFKKVRIYKSNFQGRADSIAFNETEGIIHMYTNPILWSGEKQVTGDKVEAYFNTKTKELDSLKVIGNTLLISKVDSLNLKDEFNQVKGKFMTVYYKKNVIKEAKLVGNAQSIVYVDDTDQRTKEQKRIGIMFSTCGIIGALFEENVLQIVSCSIGAVSDTYPMSMIDPSKRKFPDFNWNTKDRIRKWQDIFVDSPNYKEIQYIVDNEIYDKAQKAI